VSALRLLDVLNRTVEYFSSHGVETPRVEAEWLLSQVLGLPRLELYLRFDQPIAEAELARIRPLVARRGKREPLAYILGQAHFHEVVLRVDSRVLIPRPETELLVEAILQAQRNTSSILDIGAGSGAIVIALAKAMPEVRAVGVDISPEALELARENASLNGVAVEFIQSDLLQGVTGKYSIIVSNPPYVTETEYAGLQPEVAKFEPRMALVAAENGLLFYRRILETAGNYLEDDGALWFEIGAGQAEAVFALGEGNGWRRDRLIHDHNGFERVVSLRKVRSEGR
jgi:release factor glutamine methyltransferase